MDSDGVRCQMESDVVGLSQMESDVATSKLESDER